jgi:hypothetical protein
MLMYSDEFMQFSPTINARADVGQASRGNSRAAEWERGTVWATGHPVPLISLSA